MLTQLRGGAAKPVRQRRRAWSCNRSGDQVVTSAPGWGLLGGGKLYSKDRLEELHPRFPAPADDKLDDLQDDAQDATTFTKDCSKVPIGWTDIAPRDRLSEFFHSSRFNFLAFTLFFLLRGFICNRFQFLTFGQKPKSSIESCPFLD